MASRKDLILNQKIMRFKCTKCGRCCSDSQTFLNITHSDIIRLKNGLKLEDREILNYIGFYTFEEKESKEFMEKMVYEPVLTEQGFAYLGLLRDETSKCVFLGKDNKCTIYEHRPRICRSFPFAFAIEEIKNKPAEMQLTYARKGIEYCPGISKSSPIVKKKKILKQLSEALVEIEADKKVVEKWNSLVKRKKITPNAGKYILFITQLPAFSIKTGN